jgi:hypothetical protein
MACEFASPFACPFPVPLSPKFSNHPTDFYRNLLKYNVACSNQSPEPFCSLELTTAHNERNKKFSASASYSILED